jgi:hypothetical protein
VALAGGVLEHRHVEIAGLHRRQRFLRRVDAADIAYSGLAPTLIGVWQLTFKVPMTVPPSPQVQVAAIVNSIPTNQDTSGNRIVTTIAVK